MEKQKNIPKLRFAEFNSDWKKEKLGEVVEFKAGYAFKSEQMLSVKSNYQILKMSNVYQSELRIDRNPSYWMHLDKKQEEFLLKSGDSILTLTGTVGKRDYGYSVMIKENNKYLLNQRLVLLREKKRKSVNGFINHLLSNERFLFYFFLEAKGGTGNQTNVGIEDVKNIQLYFPSLPEQTKIASFLTAVDEKLQALKKKKSLLEQYKKGIMQKLFSQELRFKDEKGNDFPDWEEKQVKDIFTVTRGNVLAMTLVEEKTDKEYKYPVYSSQTKNKGLAGYYKDYLFEDAITWTTDGAGAGDVNFRKGKFYCTNVCGVLLSEKGYANLFIAELLNSISRKYVSYVGNPKLMNNVMAEILINIPESIIEQTKIANFLSAIDDKINAVQQQIEKTEVWKKGLLQKMFV